MAACLAAKHTDIKYFDITITSGLSELLNKFFGKVKVYGKFMAEVNNLFMKKMISRKT